MALLVSVNFLKAAPRKTVLFDEGHGQRFLVGQTGRLDLSGLAALFQKETLRVKTSKGEITDEVLAGGDALVISGAFQPFTPPEIAAIGRFVGKGGRLCIMLHIGPPVAELLRSLDVSISIRVVHEQENLLNDNDLDYYITDLKPHALLTGLERFSVFGGWGLLNTKANAQIIARTSAKSWLDLNRDGKLDEADAVQPLGLVVAGTSGAGHFVVFGDDAVFQNQFLTGENALLGKNLAGWLSKAGETAEKATNR